MPAPVDAGVLLTYSPSPYQVATGFAFRINGGYFIRPGHDGRHTATTPPVTRSGAAGRSRS